ncbi:putative nuclear protein SDK3 [Patellaria atrata CBS 101060]|uniref:Nuclear protein SDK3 n=1 Tax=Patellaria atrata CBS 101060 TaxID=1346257 RepID=A0A9P4S2G2_9PEZI|nr:putative nuclear protein SDK3 [Patellaria atrata CBS 101060]
MSDTQPVIASAVVVPEADPQESISPTPTGKRRQSSSAPDTQNKRPRVKVERENDTLQEAKPTPAELRALKRKNGEIEERKRGQRLFGALLGTLSQSSSSAAQRRRADIEKKQQEKLKQQAEEHDESKRRKLDDLMAVRRREQKKFDEQSMRIRHSNLLATANFLYTRTEPRLYYKPWELRPKDEDIIKAQIEEAEATIDRELDEFEQTREKEKEKHGAESNDLGENDVDTEQPKPSNEVGSSGDHAKSPDVLPNGDTNQQSPPLEDQRRVEAETNGKMIPEPEESKEGGDENVDVVMEADEDTVIY